MRETSCSLVFLKKVIMRLYYWKIVVDGDHNLTVAAMVSKKEISKDPVSEILLRRSQSDYWYGHLITLGEIMFIEFLLREGDWSRGPGLFSLEDALYIWITKGI